MSIIQVATEELRPIICRYNGVGIFARALEKIRTTEDQQLLGTRMVEMFKKYVQFNFPFSGSVVCLAGKIILCKDLFQCPDDYPFRNVSREIASCVFVAAADEFIDGNIVCAPTHSTLAKVFFVTVQKFYKQKIINLEEIDGTKNELASMIQKGYGVYDSNDVQMIFSALGFHLASEMLAVDEFNFLNNFFSQYFLN